MRTPRERLEYRTKRILTEIALLAELSKTELLPADIKKVDLAIHEAMNDAINALYEQRDSGVFKL